MLSQSNITQKICRTVHIFIKKSNKIFIPIQSQQQQRYYIPSTILLSKFSSSLDPHCPQPLTDDSAYELILTLKDSERLSMKNAIEKYDAFRVKQGFEGQLAANRWRSRFGRPAKMPALGEVDPSGSYCKVPDDWLRKKSAEKAKAPSTSELWKIFMVNAVPFIGFGFLDNFTMIIAGDYIEHAFGLFMCISTMAAAGLGNTISDVIGIGSAYYVERLSEMLGLKAPNLTPVQMDMKTSRRAGNMGRIFGITLGCLIGMFPLLFIDTKKKTIEDNDIKTAPDTTANT